MAVGHHPRLRDLVAADLVAEIRFEVGKPGGPPSAVAEVLGVALRIPQEVVVGDHQVPRVADEGEAEQRVVDLGGQVPAEHLSRRVWPELPLPVGGVVVDADADPGEPAVGPVVFGVVGVAPQRVHHARPGRLGHVDEGEAVAVGDEHGAASGAERIAKPLPTRKSGSAGQTHSPRTRSSGV